MRQTSVLGGQQRSNRSDHAMGQAGDTDARGGRLGHNMVVLSWVSFFQDAASELLYPVLPLFVTGVLGAPPAVVGLIEGWPRGPPRS